MTIRPTAQQPRSEVAIEIVGSNTFGRNAKMSSAATYNMIISDGWLVNNVGYKKVIETNSSGLGRRIYASSRGGFMIAVIGNNVFRLSGPPNALVYQQIFTIDTFFGDVSIDENIAYQIAICDGLDLWIYDWRANTAAKATLPINTQTSLPIVPGFVSYHDGYFHVADTSSANDYLSPLNDGLGNWDWGSGGTAPVFISIQTKPDFCEAALRAPGKGSLLYLIGQNVTEMYNDVGGQIVIYERNSSVSIDYGCVSSNTIATMDEYVAFLGTNEKSGYAIMVSTGGPFQRISTDGIDFKLGTLSEPSKSTAFFTKIAGHVLYQLTFYGEDDNYTLVYDFNTNKFFYATDENMNYHIAESVASYNNRYYFVSLNDGDIYEMSQDYTTYDYRLPGDTSTLGDYEIPCMRITNSVEQEDSSPFIGNSFTFLLEQGVDPYYKSTPKRFITTESGKVLTKEAEEGYVGAFLSTERVLDNYRPRIDLSISRDSGETFGNPYSFYLNPLGVRQNRVIFYGLGSCNTMTLQLRFWSKFRKTVSNGVLAVREREGV